MVNAAFVRGFTGRRLTALEVQEYQQIRAVPEAIKLKNLVGPLSIELGGSDLQIKNLYKNFRKRRK